MSGLLSGQERSEAGGVLAPRFNWLGFTEKCPSPLLRKKKTVGSGNNSVGWASANLRGEAKQRRMMPPPGSPTKKRGAGGHLSYRHRARG